jgi:uncharacterized membrane-anchored protein
LGVEAVGYWKAAPRFGASIGLITIACRFLDLNSILAFGIAHILTRPLGESIRDDLSQPRADGGPWLGATTTRLVFLTAIVVVVVYLTRTKKDQVGSSGHVTP